MNHGVFRDRLPDQAITREGDAQAVVWSVLAIRLSITEFVAPRSMVPIKALPPTVRVCVAWFVKDGNSFTVVHAQVEEVIPLVAVVGKLVENGFGPMNAVAGKSVRGKRRLRRSDVPIAKVKRFKPPVARNREIPDLENAGVGVPQRRAVDLATVLPRHVGFDDGILWMAFRRVDGSTQADRLFDPDVIEKQLADPGLQAEYIAARQVDRRKQSHSRDEKRADRQVEFHRCFAHP